MRRWRLPCANACCMCSPTTRRVWWRTVSYRHEPLDALVVRALTGGTQGVMQVAITAPQNQAKRKHDPNDHDHQQ